MNIPLTSVEEVQFEPAKGSKNGYLNLVVFNGKRVSGVADASKRLSAVVFSRRDQPAVEEFRARIDAEVRKLVQNGTVSGGAPHPAGTGASGVSPPSTPHGSKSKKTRHRTRAQAFIYRLSLIGGVGLLAFILVIVIAVIADGGNSGKSGTAPRLPAPKNHATATAMAIDSNIATATAPGASGATATTAAGQPTSYNVAITGSLPSYETVGDSVQLSIAAQNNGKDIPHLILDFDGLGSWVIDGVSGCNGDGTAINGYGNPYDFGAVSAGSTCNVTLDLTAQTSGNPTLGVTTYADLTSDGLIDTGTSVDNPEASVQWTPSINP